MEKIIKLKILNAKQRQVIILKRLCYSWLFRFSKKFIFNDCIKSLLSNKQKINNEYYMDLVIKEGIKKI